MKNLRKIIVSVIGVAILAMAVTAVASTIDAQDAYNTVLECCVVPEDIMFEPLTGSCNECGWFGFWCSVGVIMPCRADNPGAMRCVCRW
ncbi:MAG: hypothetical protein FWE21_09760 [Defluviitaleaceae bacterium]|nr:hypothetical protein [Defluviitaleaceae bacterium]